jgi:hypothetical protein
MSNYFPTPLAIALVVIAVALPVWALVTKPAHADRQGDQWRIREACLHHHNVQDVESDNFGYGYTGVWIVVCKDGVVLKLSAD